IARTLKSGTISDNLPVLVVSEAVSAPADPIILSESCTDNVLSFDGSPDPGTTWYWQGQNKFGESQANSNSTYTATQSGTYYLRAYKDGMWSDASGVSVTLKTAPAIPPAFQVSANECGPKNLIIRNNIPDEETWYWQGTDANGTSKSNQEAIYVAETSGTYYLRAFNGCFWSTPRGIAVTVKKASPLFEVSGGGQSCEVGLNSYDITLSGSVNGTPYQLLRDGSPLGNPLSGTGSVITWSALTEQGSYTVEAVDQNGNCHTLMDGSAQIVVNPGLCGNYLTTRQIRIPVQNENSIPSQVEKVTETTQYVDGVGRPIQTVVKQGSPSKKDVVQPVTYDGFSRVATEYLPYTSGNDGALKTNAINTTVYENSDQYNFYQHTADVIHDEMPFQVQVFEKTPMSRVVEQGAPGTAYQPENGHGRTMDYETNTAADQVRIWKIVNGKPVSTEIYAPGELIKVTTADENGNEVQSFKDKLGRDVMAVQVALNARTYNVYDDLGNAAFVLPPQMVANMTAAGSYAPTQSTLDNWAYQYQFDYRNRLVCKKLPGAERIYLIYDARDRLVLTQDGNQRLENKWLFTKYDQFDRPVVTGWYYDADAISKEAMQAKVDEFYNSGAHPSRWYEVRIEEQFKYTSRSFPAYQQPAAVNELPDNILSMTFYDKYYFLYYAPHMSFNADFAGQTHLTDPHGQVTATMVRVLGTDTFLKTINYYENKYRLLQSYTENVQGTVDRVSMQYDFVGNVVTAKAFHKDYEIVETTAHDHASRPVKQWHEIIKNGVSQGRKLMADQEYNELGQLIEKGLFSEDLGNSFLQKVGYQYNIRGWMTHINNGTQYDDATDKFGMQLEYETAGQFNGNIGKISWKTMGGLNNNIDEQSFDYTYDALNRVKKATYFSPAKAGFYDVTGNDNGIAYDLNGNILNLSRKFNNQLTDNLQYTYNEGNQLSKVTDASGNPELFDNGNSGHQDDYTYDANGNMIADANKGIINIIYNFMNLPKKVVFDDGTWIDYTYDAAGIKLEKISSTGEVKQYVGSFQYEKENGQPDVALAFIMHSEGRIHLIEDDALLTDYNFDLKDHLGNSRVTLDERGNVIQRDDYYPFGLTFNSWHVSPKNDYLYNGKEYEEKAKWYEYESRFHDAAIGRFSTIDPLAEEFVFQSPYVYAANNPVRFIDFRGEKPGNGDQSEENPNTKKTITYSASIDDMSEQSRWFETYAQQNLQFDLKYD
ncbi:MAG: DUF6443 domain-containing protein, partial [Bacteroidota bacterium]